MKPRVFISSALLAAFLMALMLASSPGLHGKLHKVDSDHECAATMIAAGNCEHSAPSVAPKIQNLPVSPAFLPHSFRFVIAAVPSSIQEHAPPVAP